MTHSATLQSGQQRVFSGIHRLSAKFVTHVNELSQLSQHTYTTIQLCDSAQRVLNRNNTKPNDFDVIVNFLKKSIKKYIFFFRKRLQSKCIPCSPNRFLLVK